MSPWSGLMQSFQQHNYDRCLYDVTVHTCRVLVFFFMLVVHRPTISDTMKYDQEENMMLISFFMTRTKLTSNVCLEEASI
eukprot:c19894_g1_i1 orf=116-355(+)